MKGIKVFAPATVANVSCGYDVLGFAVNTPGDEVVMHLNDSGEVSLDVIEGDEGRLPRDPAKNTVSAVVINYLNHLGIKQGVSIALYKKMPFGSGLGSSSASAVAGLVGINELMGKPLTQEQLLPFAMEGERLACGNAHADNVAPALLGGLVLIRSYNPLDVVKLPVPAGLACALVYPHVEIPTKEARQILRTHVPLQDAVTQWGNVAGLVAGFCTNNLDLISRSMQDVIIEPVRAMLIPCFSEMRQLAMEQKALGFGISGSGPSVFSLCSNLDVARNVTAALTAKLSEAGIDSTAYVSEINLQGPQVKHLQPALSKQHP
ncbi:homoserine kinase [Pontibacter korlensis]|uniref:Homoserine kinase n=1 Tax=Pontibacter korlensis TaxID=400092 RepID=A0A0E3UUZ5_9BACT|nr:homoserine kinase [Pontibacter korlensis]AKD02087.1 serine kinase [Pontibacter korlensis]